MLVRSLLPFIVTLLCTPTLAGSPQYIDLSHVISPSTLNYPGVAPFKITRAVAETTPTGFYWSLREYSASEHSGTHIDAPNHFAKGRKGVNEIALSSLIGPAITIDVRHEVKKDSDYQIEIKDFEQWEVLHGKIPSQTIILLNTGHGKFWPNLKTYGGAKQVAGATQLHFPGLAPKAAEWLVQMRHLKAIGIDTFSIDYGQTKTYESHQILTKNNIPIFENVASMELLPPDHFTIYALPVKIKDGTGAPLRIVAEIQ